MASSKSSNTNVLRGVLALIAFVIIIILLVKLWQKKEKFSNAPKVIFYFFYMPGCPHCEAVDSSRNADPDSVWNKFIKAAGKSTDVIIIPKKVDGTNTNDPDVVKYSSLIKGFPSFVMDYDTDVDGSKAQIYSGDRTSDGFMNGIKQFISK